MLLLLVLIGGAARADDVDPLDPGRSRTRSRRSTRCQGIDPDGRIPAIVRPADLPNPERWRYIPEGRLKPGNVFQRFLVSSMIAPFVFYDGDVGTGFGVALVDIDFREQRRREFAGAFLSYTTEGQQNYTFVWRRWLHHRRAAGRRRAAGGAQPRARGGRLQPLAHAPLLRDRPQDEGGRRDELPRLASASSRSASTTRCRIPATISC